MRRTSPRELSPTPLRAWLVAACTAPLLACASEPVIERPVSGTSSTGGSTITQASGGAGGHGGANSQGGAGGATGAAGHGGAGGVVGGCASPKECPGQDTDCQARTCINGACGISHAPAGTLAGPQPKDTCRKVVCDGAGALMIADDDANVPVDANPCTADVCTQGVPSNPFQKPGAACNENGGTQCDATGHCVQCLDAKDCPSGACQINQCAPPYCGDGLENGTETDVDCGGLCPLKCAIAAACDADVDCGSGLCVGKKCLPSSCQDKQKNGTESDVDCGGLCGPGCGPGQACKSKSDCSTSVCTGGVCVAPDCGDGVKNGSETDVDCGGACPNKCGLGGSCKQDVDCKGGQCAPGGNVCLPTCTDGLLDGQETDLDCGGLQCPACAVGQVCKVGDDCATQSCGGAGNPTTCQGPTCNDGAKNGGETYVDCGGGACPACPDGAGCTLPADCQSGVCKFNSCAVPGCYDFAKNGQETDVDCGGACQSKCAAAKGCLVGGDCKSGVCTAGACS